VNDDGSDGTHAMVASTNQPKLTRPMWFAFIAFAIFAAWALFPNSGSKFLAVTPDEYEELKKFTLFFIAALLPSDALVRFGRNLLFSKVEDAAKAASDAPASTLAQNLAFGAFVVVAGVMLVSDSWIDQSEAPKIIDVARVLVVALLPSDAGVRFGRAIYLRGISTLSEGQPKLVATPSSDQLARV
jgi:hypothetical protein